MSQADKWSKVLLRVAVAVFAGALWASAPAEASSVTVDGVVTASDGYTVIKTMTFGLEKTTGVFSGATLGLFQDSDYNVFVALTLPRSLVDNSYGANAIGWPVDHKFEQLAGSDKANLVFSNGGTTLLDVTLDYLAGTGKDQAPPYSADTTSKDFKVDVGSPACVLAASSSLFYNWQTFGLAYPDLFGKGKSSPAADSGYVPVDAEFDGWVFDVTYEFEIAGSVFGGPVDLTTDFVTVHEVHASPNKLGGNKASDFITTETITPPEAPAAAVPEPLTMLSVLLGVGGIGSYIRRRVTA